MRLNSSLILLSGSLIILQGAGCASIQCGVFRQNVVPYVSDFGEAVPGVVAQIEFDFDPAKCEANCQCDQIVFIQLIRILDVATQKFIALYPEQEQRMVKSGGAQGWWIDRPPGATSPFFKQLNNGTFTPELVPGSNAKTASLIDRPVLQQHPLTLFQFVDVPVCISGDTGCINRILGFSSWGFVIDKNEKVTAQNITTDGARDHTKEFFAAVDAWNAVVPQGGKISVPPFQPLGH
jgi:hypothetical protein